MVILCTRSGFLLLLTELKKRSFLDRFNWVNGSVTLVTEREKTRWLSARELSLVALFAAFTGIGGFIRVPIPFVRLPCRR